MDVFSYSFFVSQGKEDLTPRVALREHNESQVSQGTGMLRVAKTTPSRLKALFTSSKVANAATIPTRKDEVLSDVSKVAKFLGLRYTILYCL